MSKSDIKVKNDKKKKKRCNFKGCKKKLNLVDLERKCKCQKIFCSKHRTANDHNCSFDYKTNKDNILKINSLGGGNPDKINKI